MKLSEIKTKLASIKEILIIIGAIFGMLMGALVYISSEFKQYKQDRALQDDEFIGAITERIRQDLDPLSTKDFEREINHRDSMDHAMIEMGTEHYIRHLVRQDSIIIALARLEQFDRDFDAEIHKIQIQLASIDHRAEKTGQHLRDTQLTDSLQNELMRIQMMQRTMKILDEMEQNHREELKKIQEGKAAEYTSSTRRTPKGLKIMTHQKKSRNR